LNEKNEQSGQGEIQIENLKRRRHIA